MLDSIDEHHEQYNSVLSYYGLSQVLEVIEGDVFLNLACAELQSGNRKRAIDALHLDVIFGVRKSRSMSPND